MPEKKLNEIPRDVRDLYQKGHVALQRQNFDYAITLLGQVLQREPGFFECRQALRAAQFRKAGGSSSFFKKMLGGANPNLAKAKLSMQKDPLEAMNILEQVFNSDPQNSTAHKMMADAALAADMPRTACLSLEILRKNDADDYDLGMEYGEALVRCGEIQKAETVYSDLYKAHPHRSEIAMALKNLSAKRTMSEGGYDALADGSGSYRDILKNKDEAVSLEQESRVVRSEDRTDELIREYEARIVAEPKNLKLLRNIAELYAQKKEFDRALEAYERIRSSEVGADPSLEKAIAETALKRFDHRAAQLDAAAPDYSDQLAKLQAERAEFQLAECKNRAEKYPTDLQIKFEYGQLLFQTGKTSEAIQEFQKAKANPNRRLAAMSFLAQCFARRNMNDLAARTLQEALKEKPGFDDEKKELIYQLGCVLEKMTKKEEAIEQFKLIYEVDISYKDVAAKVDAYYSGQG